MFKFEKSDINCEPSRKATLPGTTPNLWKAGFPPIPNYKADSGWFPGGSLNFLGILGRV